MWVVRLQAACCRSRRYLEEDADAVFVIVVVVLADALELELLLAEFVFVLVLVRVVAAAFCNIGTMVAPTTSIDIIAAAITIPLTI